MPDASARPCAERQPRGEGRRGPPPGSRAGRCSRGPHLRELAEGERGPSEPTAARLVGTRTLTFPAPSTGDVVAPGPGDKPGVPPRGEAARGVPVDGARELPAHASPGDGELGAP